MIALIGADLRWIVACWRSVAWPDEYVAALSLVARLCFAVSCNPAQPYTPTMAWRNGVSFRPRQIAVPSVKGNFPREIPLIGSGDGPPQPQHALPANGRWSETKAAWRRRAGHAPPDRRQIGWLQGRRAPRLRRPSVCTVAAGDPCVL